MRLTGILLGAVLAGSVVIPAAAQSEGRRGQWLSGMPKYDPSIRAEREAAKAKQPARSPVDADVLVLPEYEVVEKKLHRPNEQELLTKAARERAAMLEFARDMNALDLALNRWHIPFLSASFAQRAVADQNRKRLASQLAGFAHIADVAERVDPASAKAIREALRRR